MLKRLLLLVLFFLSAWGCFSQVDAPKVESLEQLLTASKKQLLMALKENQNLKLLLKEKDALLTKWLETSQTLEEVSQTFKTYGSELRQELSTLTERLESSEKHLIDIQTSIGEQENQLGLLKADLLKAYDFSTQLLKDYRKTVIKAVIITGSITVGVIGLILVLVSVL